MSTWPTKPLAVSLLIALILSMVVLSDFDGGELARLALFVAIAGIGVVRWIIARRRGEKNNDWKIYFALICLSPVATMLLYEVWEVIYAYRMAHWHAILPPAGR